MRLFAFEGLRYRAGAAEAGLLAAPPYDQIDDRLRDRCHAQAAHQFVHLTRPLAPVPAGGLDMYAHAAALHARWLADGTIERDPRPALYPYVIQLAGGGRRLGVCGLAGFAGPSVIRPHEQTLDKPLADRLALLRAMRVDLEPVFLLSEGRFDRLIEEDIEEDAAGAEPLVDHRDADGHHHLLFRVDEPGRIARYKEALEGRPAAIADGHHRYKVGQRFAHETGAVPGTAAAAKLAVITSIDSPALTIDPIHRALRAAVDPGRLGMLGVHREPWSGGGGAELAAAVAVANTDQPAIGVWEAGRSPEVWRLDPGHAPDSLAPGARQLAVALLHESLLPALGYPPAAATDGTVIYRSDPEALWTMVHGGEVATGIWLPPMRPAAFAAAIAHGDMLPPKSTRFLPKVMSGLVWADHESKLL